MQRSLNSAYYEILRRWLIEKRQDKGISLRALASELGCHHSILGKIEHGDRKLDFIEYVEYCQALSVDPHEGLSLINEKMASEKRTHTNSSI